MLSKRCFSFSAGCMLVFFVFIYELDFVEMTSALALPTSSQSHVIKVSFSILEKRTITPPLTINDSFFLLFSNLFVSENNNSIAGIKLKDVRY